MKELEEYINDFELEKCCFSKIIIEKEKELEEKRRIQEIKRKLRQFDKRKKVYRKNE